MFDIVGKRRWYFTLSTCLILLGLVAMVISVIRFGSPVRLSIDFTSGSLLEYRFGQAVPPADVREVFVEQGLGAVSVQSAGDGKNIIIRSKVIEAEAKTDIEQSLRAKFGDLTELRYETVGPAVGREVTRGAVMAVAASAVVILMFIAFAFRKIPNSFRYGVCAILAMLHNVWIAIGLYSLWGLLFGWEVDAPFLTALLAVIGFSMSDPIVVFDRIRENLPKRRGEPFEVVVNRSLLETLHRSLATQLNAMFILVALVFFGGATIKLFALTMLVGLITGTYSSIFVAVPLLVTWETGGFAKFFRRGQPAQV